MKVEKCEKRPFPARNINRGKNPRKGEDRGIFTRKKGELKMVKKTTKKGYWSLRVDHLQHGFWHLVHGIVPGWHYAEKKVETPDFDHVPAKGKFNVKGYWEHLIKNYRCFCRHRVVGRWPFMEVKFK